MYACMISYSVEYMHICTNRDDRPSSESSGRIQRAVQRPAAICNNVLGPHTFRTSSCQDSQPQQTWFCSCTPFEHCHPPTTQMIDLEALRRGTPCAEHTGCLDPARSALVSTNFLQLLQAKFAATVNISERQWVASALTMSRLLWEESWSAYTGPKMPIPAGQLSLVHNFAKLE